VRRRVVVILTLRFRFIGLTSNSVGQVVNLSYRITQFQGYNRSAAGKDGNFSLHF
jgi:hypothetical protein